MGAITVPGYNLYKAVRKRDHADQRVPVGMPDKLWRIKLAQQRIDAQVSHAAWVARNIARWVETRRRMGTGLEDALTTVQADELLKQRLGLYSVHEFLLGACIAQARALVLERQKELA